MIIRILAGYYLILSILMVGALVASNNIALYRWLYLLSAISLGTYFYQLMTSVKRRLVVLLLIMINAAYFLNANIFHDGTPVFDSLAFVILSACITILIFMYMYQLLSRVTADPLSLNFDFWFVSSQLIYYLGAFAIFLTYGFMTNKVLTNDALDKYTNVLTWLWGFHNVLLFLSALITTGSIAWISYHRKSPSS